ncbi:retrovirus-related pol polyprotein from transposon TNT 1-94, partial [Tanacetum coccineum]
SLFESSSKDSDDNNKDNDGPCQKSECAIQERPNAQNSTNNINTAGSSNNTTSLNIKTIGPTVNVRQSNDFFGAENDMLHLDEVVVDINNVFTTYFVPTTPNTRIHKDHSLDNVIGDIQSGVQTRRMTVTTNQQGFLGAIYEEKTHEDLYILDLPRGKRAIGTRWVFRNKKDDRGIVIRNKARLVTQGFTQEEGIDYEEVFAPVEKEYKVEKALYGLHQAPIAWYETLSKYLMANGFQRGKTDQTLFIKRQKEDILLIQVQDKYVDDILRKINYADVKITSTPIDKEMDLLKDSHGDDVDKHLYRIFRYLKGNPKLGLWYLRDSPFDLVAYTDSDYAGASLDKKSTLGGCQFLGCRLISWQCIK